MDLRVKDILVIMMSLGFVFLVGYLYVFIENYIFGEVLADYISYTWIIILRIIWTAMMVKWVCNMSKIIVVGVNDVDLKRLEAITKAEEEKETKKERSGNL